MIRQTRSLFRQFSGQGVERRGHERHELDVETVCRPVGEDTDYPARIRNVSRSGVGLVVAHPVREGTMIRVSIPGSAAGPRTTLLACVTNVREREDGEWSLGCIFCLELSAAEMAAFGGVKTAGGPDDPRAWVRCPGQGAVEYRVLPGDDDSPGVGELVDLSPGGVGLVLDECLHPGTALTVRLRRKDDRGDQQMLACVVYLSRRADGKWGTGCQFLRELSEAELQGLIWQPVSV